MRIYSSVLNLETIYYLYI